MGFAAPKSSVDIMPYSVITADDLHRMLDMTPLARAQVKAHIENRCQGLNGYTGSLEPGHFSEWDAWHKARNLPPLTLSPLHPGYLYGIPKSECPVHAKGNKRDLRAVYYFRRFYNPFDSTEYQSKPERVTSGCVCGR